MEAAIAKSEAQVPNLRAGCEKRIVWAGNPRCKTKRAVLFVHGFSASLQELRPLPDLVAQGLGANLFFARLTGHGQDGAALGEATLPDWRRDMDEALAVTATLGDEVIVIGCSTGCTLATLALAQGASVAAMIHISPNFGLSHKLAQALLDAPLSDKWGHLLAGGERSFAPISAAHAAYWTLTYPTKAVFVMAEAVRAAKAAQIENIRTPALFCFNEDDQVVSAEQTRRIIARWGGPVQSYLFDQTAEDDAMGHIMAGDIFSPGQTEPLAQRILAWLNEEPASGSPAISD